jgi:hypothetical protein
LETGGRLIFYPGDTVRTIEIEVIDDHAYEGTGETFTISLSNPTGDTGLGSITSAEVTILENDPSGQVQFSAPEYYGIEESGMVMVKITRTGSTEEAATVQYRMVSGTATAGADFVSAEGTLTFAPGQTSKKVQIKLIDDKLKEYNETFSIQLTNPAGGAVIGAQASAVVNILDKDHLKIRS